MSTIASTEPMRPKVGRDSRAALVIAEGGDQRTVFRGVDWHTYHQLSESMGDHQPVRLIYDGKDLEIVITGNVHDYYCFFAI